MKPIGCPETSLRDYHYSLRNNPEGCSSHLLGGGSLKSRIPLHLPTSWCGVLGKLTGLQLVKKFPAFYGTRTHKRLPPVPILCQPNPVHIPTTHLLEIHPNIIHPYTTYSGFGGLGVARWPFVPKSAGSNPAEAVGFLGRKNPQHVFLRRGSKAVCPIS